MTQPVTVSSRPMPPPRANPFDVSAPYATLMRWALALAVLPGFGIGLLLIVVFGFRLPLVLPLPQLGQVHGQVQLLGFTALFIMAVGLQLFPRFLAAAVPRPDHVVLGGVLIGTALLVRLVAQPLEPGAPRMVMLLWSALSIPVGVGLALNQFRLMRQRSVQPIVTKGGVWQWFIALGVGSFVVAVLLHSWGLVLLAFGEVMLPLGLNEALIHLEIEGLATCLILGVGSRIFGRFLLLRTRPALEERLPEMTATYAAGLVLTVVGWMADFGWAVLLGYALQLGILVVWLWFVGLYETPARPSGTPYVTNPTRRWFRAAFGFLVAGVAAVTILQARELLAGQPMITTELSAARHAVTQGFMLVLMVGMAARMLPIYSADVLKRRWQLELIVQLLLVGAFLRAVAELAGGYGGIAGPIAAVGGLTSGLGFFLFAWGLWDSLGRLPGMPGARKTIA